jgi:hypothetical protein
MWSVCYRSQKTFSNLLKIANNPLQINTPYLRFYLEENNATSSYFLSHLLIDYYGVRLRLWAAVTGGHIVHPPDDTSVESDSGMILTGEN